jgi:hypothetical protein
MNKPYYRAEHDENADWCDDYDMLKGPNGFECCLTEPEDRTWYRDGSRVIGELNKLFAERDKAVREVARLKKLLAGKGNP